VDQHGKLASKACPRTKPRPRAIARIPGWLFLRFLLLGVIALSPAVAQQTVTYPGPVLPGAGVTFPTSVNQTVTFDGNCPGDIPVSTSSPFAEALFAPFFFVNGFPTSEAAPGGPSGSLPFSLNQILTLANGVSEYQGTVTLSGTSGVYPATPGSGTGTSVTYTILVSGRVVTEQYSADVQVEGQPGLGVTFQDLSYTFNSTYDIQTGIQNYSMSWNAKDLDNVGTPCTSTSSASETGSVTYNYFGSAPNGLGPANPIPALGPAGGPSNPQGCCGDPVSTGNGNYYYSHTDLSVSNYIPDLPLEFKRSYNSLETNGTNWTNNFNIGLGSVTISGSSGIGVRWGDGHYEVYFQRGSGFIPLAPATGSLTTDSTTGTYTLTRKDGVKYFFTSAGYLSSIQNRNGQALTLTRDGNNNLLSVSDSQQQLSFGYGSNLLLSTVTDLSGRTISLAYDASGNLISETDPAGNITQYSYDSLNNLASVTLPNGVVQVQNTFGPFGAVVSQTNANGFTTTFSYASPPGTGPTTITDSLGHVTVHNYPAPGTSLTAIQSIVDPLGHTTSFTYGQTVTYSYKGNPYNVFFGSAACPPECGVSGSFTVAAPLQTGTEFLVTPLFFSFTDGVATLTTTSASNPFAVVTDSSGAITGWNIFLTTPGYFIATGTNPPGCVGCGVLDGSGDNGVSQGAQISNDPGTWTVSVASGNNIASITDANGHTSNFTYDALGNILTNTDPLGNTTTFTYNVFSEPLTNKTPRGNTTSLFYDAKGNLLTVADPLGDTTALTYDTAGHLLTVTDPKGNTTSFAYGACSFCVSTITDPIGNVTSFAYDSINRPLSSTDANKHTSSVTYDALSRVTSLADALGNQTLFAYDSVSHLTGVTDANKNVTSYGYDPVGNLTLVTDAMGHNTTYTYDANNNLSSFTNGNSHITSYGYDTANRLLKATSPKKEITSYTYDAKGNVVSITDGNGRTTNYSYDADNRQTGIAYADGSTVAYTFDADGDRLNMMDAHGTSSYAYDALNRILSIAFPGGNNLQYSYDAAGNKTSLQYPDGSAFAYSYDQDNRLLQLVDSQSRNTSYVYDPAGNVTRLTYPNGVTQQFGYDAANRLSQLVDQNAAGLFRALTYALDAVGNRTMVTDNGVATKYAYNAINELKSSTTAKAKTTWNYNGVGNRTQQVAPTGITPYTYDAAERMLTAGPATFTYDKNGNRLTEVSPFGTTTYAYDLSNRLVSVVSPTGTSSFAYDGDGTRVSQTTPLGAYSYVDDTNGSFPLVISENGPDGAINYGYGLGLLESSNAVFNYFYSLDGLGSVSNLTDATGTVQQTYSYDAWGNSLAQIGSIGTKNKFQFAGQAIDPATGLYFMRARYYEPSTGRFLRKDPFPGFEIDPITLHHYVYARNNPVRFTDPTGLSDSGAAGWLCQGAFTGACLLGTDGAGALGAVCGAAGLLTCNVVSGKPPFSPSNLQDICGAAALAIPNGPVGAVVGLACNVCSVPVNPVPFGTAGHGSRPAGELY
jgi:RHS repeat-associated protein